jgi:hypothetical protein
MSGRRYAPAFASTSASAPKVTTTSPAAGSSQHPTHQPILTKAVSPLLDRYLRGWGGTPTGLHLWHSRTNLMNLGRATAPDW